jgi:hypothetical protein
VRRLAVLAVLLPALAGSAAAQGAGAARDACPPAHRSGASPAAIDAALRSGRDLWGQRLLASRAGPTYAGARGYLAPLLLARAAGGQPLTASGVLYLPFGIPAGDQGALDVALHVADGSAIVERRVGGRALTVSVGLHGTERYGSCLARLSEPRLADGWLPILETRYVDAAGIHYSQESFSTRTGVPRRLVSFVRLTADARGARSGGRAVVRFPGGSLSVPVARSRIRTVYLAWPVGSRHLVTSDEDSYAAARRTVYVYWQERLAEGMTVDVPEPRVENADRALLVQNLLLTWRYSIGNAYEQFSFPEGIDAAQVMGEMGFPDVARAMMRTALTRRDTAYPDWKMGEKLLGSATQFALFRDRTFLSEATPVLSKEVTRLGRQIDASPTGLLPREQYSSDIHDAVYGLHTQTIVWAGLRGMAAAWGQDGRPQLAADCRRLASRLGGGLRAAIRRSERRLPDGSLFLPIRLLDGEAPYRSLVEARLGSYWNLVMPYALASGFFAPGSPEARGVWRYMQLHGSRLLGLVRAGAYALYGRHAPFPVSGTDAVYGINTARFLADEGDADQLVLSLYGQLAAAMTPGTFTAGEAASVAPLAGADARAMYLPPNGAANAAFLETLRLLLVHETAGGLELAYFTPRAWLEPGKRIAVSNAPTRFGPVSYSIETHDRFADVTVDAPARARPVTLQLRLRLPPGRRIAAVTLDGRRYRHFDASTGTIDLSGHRGELLLRVGFRHGVA